jgi:hypothetical protein
MHIEGGECHYEITPFLSTFVLNKMCDIIKSSMMTWHGFKEVHLNIVGKKVLEFYGSEVSS